MQTFTRLVSGARQPLAQRASPRAFSTARQLRLKEGKPQDPQELERAKQQQGKDSKAREELESHSESNVQADREHVKDHDAHIDNLQKETAQQKENERAKGQS